jgi:hypothetical protein
MKSKDCFNNLEKGLERVGAGSYRDFLQLPSLSPNYSVRSEC